MGTQVNRLLCASTFVLLVLTVMMPSALTSDAEAHAFFSARSDALSTAVTENANLIHLDNIPFTVKKPDIGGETCIAMYLRSLGHDVTADEVFDASGVDPLVGRGCVARELVVAAKQLEDRDVKVKPNRGFTSADYAQHIRKLKQRLPNDDFKIVLQKPFVVVGDGTLAQVKRSAVGTVKWAVDSIKKDFFEKDPHHIIDVWLFKDPESYQKHNLELFDSKPGTPYGYYSPTHRVLVMDISTGGGTLVHEIVHPFMESNFEACPSWFNEGLASLYEQSSMRNGHIVGLTNWRLRGLQLTIEDGRLPSFDDLCSTTSREFYDGAATNYAQARYLCYYLQEKGLLIKYFHQFRENANEDPTGYETLKKVLRRDDMDRFQEQWEKYVLKLRFGN